MQQAAADAEHLAVGIDRDVDRPVLVALLRRIGEMLAPVLDPFDRALAAASPPPPRRCPRDRRRASARSRRRRRASRPAAGSRRGRSARSATGTGRAPSGSRPRPSCCRRWRDTRRGCRGPRSDARRRDAARAPRGRHARPWRRRHRRRRRRPCRLAMMLVLSSRRTAGAFGARPCGSRRPPAAPRSRPRPARRRPRRDSGCRRRRSRPSRRHRRPRRRRARTTTAGRAACRNSNAAACGAAPAPARDRRASAPRARRAAPAPRASMPRISACGCGLRTNAACSTPGRCDVVEIAALAGEQRPVLEPWQARADQRTMHRRRGASRQGARSPLPPERSEWGGVGGGGRRNSRRHPHPAASLADPPHRFAGEGAAAARGTIQKPTLDEVTMLLIRDRLARPCRPRPSASHKARPAACRAPGR